MKKNLLSGFALLAFFFAMGYVKAQNAPELLYYKFDGTGTTVNNDALTPPAGTATATIVGSQTQGNTGLCGSALIGTGASSNVDYVSTGWNTNLGTSPWTISFWSNNIPSSSTLFYVFGDNGAGSLRCFTNGAAGAGNWMLRGPLTDVTCVGCAPVGNSPTMTTFVYDPVSGDIKAYLNGVLNATVAQSALNISGSNFIVGGYQGNTGIGSGQLLDEFRFYDRALDANEVLITYNVCLPLLMTPDDAGVASIDSPSLPSCNLGLNDLVVSLNNYGTDTLTSCNINYTINGGTTTTVAWTGSVAPYQTLSGVIVGSATFTNGDVVAVWTDSPNGGTDLYATNDMQSITLQEGLSGLYTIGATGDYATFTDAIDALSLYGVCSAVTFDVQDGTYNEQITLSSFAGLSATNTVTFQSENSDNLLVELTYAATSAGDNYVVQLDGADYITFKDITVSTGGTSFATALLLNNSAEHNVFEGNRFLGNPAAASTSTNLAVIYSPSGSLDNFNTFTDNVIRYGSYGMYWYGQSTTNLVSGLVLEGNEFAGNYYRCLHLYYTDSTTVRNNDFSVSGLYTSLNYLVYAYYMNGNAEISNNRFSMYDYGYALYIGSSTSSPAAKAKLMNNSFVIEDLTSTSTSYGAYLTSANNWDIWNNSFNIISQGTSSRALYVASGGGNDIYNNNIKLDGPGYALYVGGGVSASDYNNLYAPNGNVGYFSGDALTLSDWQNSVGFDMNSVSGEPYYASTFDLHTCNDTLLDGAGNPAVFALLDMDGQTRDTLGSDIGADEFLGLINFGFAEDSIWKCTNDAVTLGGFEPSSDATFGWSTSEATPTILAQNPGLYTVTATTACGSAMSSVEIVNIPDAVADFTSTSSYVTGIFTSTSTGTIYSYSWDFGDGTTSTAENPIHIFPSPGYQYVSLTVTGPCGTSTYNDSILLELVGIDENQLDNSLTIYPNPNKGEFTMNISLEGASNVSATLVDARGMVIWDTEMKNINGNVTKVIDLDVAPGVYFMKVSVDDTSTLRKVLVE